MLTGTFNTLLKEPGERGTSTGPDLSRSFGLSLSVGQVRTCSDTCVSCPFQVAHNLIKTLQSQNYKLLFSTYLQSS